MWRTFLGGLCIGLADLIPGISGGTVAIILGLYERIIAALHSFDSLFINRLWRAEWRAALSGIPWAFLLTLLTGILFAIATFVHLIDYLLSQPTYRQLLDATFFGLVLASASLIMGRVRNWKPWHFILIATTALAAFSLSSRTSIRGDYQVELPASFLPSATPIVANYDKTQERLTGLTKGDIIALYAKNRIDDSTTVYSAQGEAFSADSFVAWKQERPFFDVKVFVCGILGICATLLPGISGSYCLNILGMYGPVIAAIADLSSGISHGFLPVDSLRLLTTLALGMLIGALAFARILSWALHRYHDVTLLIMIGIMLGALRSVWPFYSTIFVLDPMHWDAGPRLLIDYLMWPDTADGGFWAVIACSIAAFTSLRLANRLAQSSL